jgi:hypothetical protein
MLPRSRSTSRRSGLAACNSNRPSIAPRQPPLTNCVGRANARTNRVPRRIPKHPSSLDDLRHFAIGNSSLSQLRSLAFDQGHVMKALLVFRVLLAIVALIGLSLR